MSRRGGKRRQVLQLGDSSKLHRYGYAKGFKTKEGSGQGSSLTLVGDYSDSESEEKDEQIEYQHPYTEEGIQDDTPTVEVEEETSASVNGKGEAQSKMDDELRNFLSEIEAIPMPEETNTSDHGSNRPSPTPNDAHGTSVEIPNTEAFDGPKKKTAAYSMFVKGEIEFTHSPAPEETDEGLEEAKEKRALDAEILDIPQEPTTLWQMVQDETTQYYYYWNWQTNEVTWEIPSDYTQYLLLHKEYEEKMAKFTPKQIQAYKDKISSKEKDSKMGSNSHSTMVKDSTADDKHTHDPIKSRTGNKDPSVDSHTVDDKSSSHHHKKKKSKKHKRRHDDSEDETEGRNHHREVTKDQRTQETESENAKSLTVKRSKKGNLGPQTLSIVPYLSDNDEDDDDDDDETSKDVPHAEELTLKDEPVSTSSPAQISTSDPSKLEPEDESNPDLLGHVTDECSQSDSTVISKPGLCGEKEDGDGSHGQKELDVKIEVEATGLMLENDSAVVKDADVKVEIGGEEPKTEITSTTDGLDDHGKCLDGAVVQPKLEESFPLKKETKKKKEMINMFADETPPRDDKADDDDDEDIVSKLKLETVSKMEVEEGEISDGSESLTLSKPQKLVDSQSTEGHTEQISNSKVLMKEESNVPHAEPEAFLKGIMGYGQEDDDDEEEEEGELKEEVFKSVRKEDVKLKEVNKRDRKREDKDKLFVHKDDGKKDRYTKDVKQRENHEKVENSSSSSRRAVFPVLGSVEKESRDQSNTSEGVPPVEEKSDETIDDTEDIDFDDLDNIDRVLEMALEKKREKKTENIKQDTEKTAKDHLPNKITTSTLTKTSEADNSQDVEMSKDEKLVSDTVMDTEKLKVTVKDSAELALSKLRFLDISTKNLSKLQVLLIELQTRHKDWQAGGLSTPYFNQELQWAEALLSQYEESAVPWGWLCQWDRASSRYFYRNRRTNHTQWEYPEPDGEQTKGKGEDKEVPRKKRRSKEKEEREEAVKGRGNSSSRSSRHRSKKTQDKDRGSKRDRHGSSTHHHRKKKRRRREHSSSSSSSEEETGLSRHRHSRSKRKKKGRSDKSPSVEVTGEQDGTENAHVIEDSPPSSLFPAGAELSGLGISNKEENGDGGSKMDGTNQQEMSDQPPGLSSHLVADYGSEQDMDKEENEDEDMDGKHKKNRIVENDGGDKPDDDAAAVPGESGGGESGTVLDPSIDGEEMDKDGGEAEEEEVNSAVIIRAPQIVVPPHVAAMNQPQIYSVVPPIYSSSTVTPSATMSALPLPTGQDKEGDTTQQMSEESDKGGKKKKKDKSVKEKSLSANSSIMMKKKRVSSMVQKWQQVKKEVEKEDRAKELRQAAIREKINQLK